MNKLGPRLAEKLVPEPEVTRTKEAKDPVITARSPKKAPRRLLHPIRTHPIKKLAQAITTMLCVRSTAARKNADYEAKISPLDNPLCGRAPSGNYTSPTWTTAWPADSVVRGAPRCLENSKAFLDKDMTVETEIVKMPPKLTAQSRCPEVQRVFLDDYQQQATDNVKTSPELDSGRETLVSDMEPKVPQAGTKACAEEVLQTHAEQGLRHCSSCDGFTYGHCKDCQGPICRTCSIDDCCYDCFSGLPGQAPAALVVEEKKALKAGQIKQLAAGARQAGALRKHGVWPSRVEASCKAKRQEPGNKAKPLLLEWCCAGNSQLAKEWRYRGGEAKRYGIPEFDLSSRKEVRSIAAYAKEALKQGREVSVHCSFPCSSWCGIHNFGLIKANEKYRHTIKIGRQKSSRMLALFIDAFGPLLSAYPTKL